MPDKKTRIFLILVVITITLGCIGDSSDNASDIKDIRVDGNSKVQSDIRISQISVSEAPDFNPNIQRDIVIWTSKEKGINNVYMKNLSNNEVSILFKNVSSAGLIEEYVYYSAPMAQEDAILYNVTLILDVGLGWKDTNGVLVPLKYGGYVLSYEGPTTCDSEFRYAFEKIKNDGAHCELSDSITKGYNLSIKKTEILSCGSFCFENLDEYNSCLEQKKLWSKRVAGDDYKSLLDAPNFINLSSWMCNNTFQGVPFPTTARRNIVDDAGRIRISDIEILLKWEDGFFEGNLIKMYKDLSDVNPFYKNLTDADLLKKVDGLIIKKYFRCYNWEGKDTLYSSKECTDRQDILKIYYPKKDKIYVLEGHRYKFSGGLYSSKSEVVSRGLFNEIKDVKSFDNRFVWVDNINQKCIKIDGKQECDGNTDVYLGVLE